VYSHVDSTLHSTLHSFAASLFSIVGDFVSTCTGVFFIVISPKTPNMAEPKMEPGLVGMLCQAGVSPTTYWEFMKTSKGQRILRMRFEALG
jgi:hypothetical protein